MDQPEDEKSRFPSVSQTGKSFCPLGINIVVFPGKTLDVAQRSMVEIRSHPRWPVLVDPLEHETEVSPWPGGVGRLHPSLLPSAERRHCSPRGCPRPAWRHGHIAVGWCLGHCRTRANTPDLKHACGREEGKIREVEKLKRGEGGLGEKPQEKMQADTQTAWRQGGLGAHRRATDRQKACHVTQLPRPDRGVRWMWSWVFAGAHHLGAPAKGGG